MSLLYTGAINDKVSTKYTNTYTIIPVNYNVLDLSSPTNICPIHSFTLFENIRISKNQNANVHQIPMVGAIINPIRAQRMKKFIFYPVVRSWTRTNKRYDSSYGEETWNPFGFQTHLFYMYRDHRTVTSLGDN